LCRDYSIDDPEPSVVPLRSLLKHLAQSHASMKILVLDMGSVAYDARLGMVVNEFPALVTDQVAQNDDPTLWVLASNSLFQTSKLSPAENQTIFAESLFEALLGNADRDTTNSVED